MRDYQQLMTDKKLFNSGLNQSENKISASPDVHLKFQFNLAAINQLNSQGGCQNYNVSPDMRIFNNSRNQIDNQGERLNNININNSNCQTATSPSLNYFQTDQSSHMRNISMTNSPLQHCYQDFSNLNAQKSEKEMEDLLENDIEDFDFNHDVNGYLQISSQKYQFSTAYQLTAIDDNNKLRLFKIMAKRIKQLKQNVRDINISSKRIKKNDKFQPNLMSSKTDKILLESCQKYQKSLEVNISSINVPIYQPNCHIQQLISLQNQSTTLIETNLRSFKSDKPIEFKQLKNIHNAKTQNHPEQNIVTSNIIENAVNYAPQVDNQLTTQRSKILGEFHDEVITNMEFFKKNKEPKNKYSGQGKSDLEKMFINNQILSQKHISLEYPLENGIFSKNQNYRGSQTSYQFQQNQTFNQTAFIKHLDCKEYI
eukprot:403342124